MEKMRILLRMAATGDFTSVEDGLKWPDPVRYPLRGLRWDLAEKENGASASTFLQASAAVEYVNSDGIPPP
ncbi:hypothetical protein AK812_SmicGene23739 [Symbiodinium microadriaticum]|uniref:Uncharacterized protein n=1 Tax=Symbiodinium microadriaticum TaxID=2951 RepID=A0A1Q9DGF3_SYMMI|nr:hypothetical protein AK812_SmicGene23739 [Symbiodinium microadriaticum]